MVAIDPITRKKVYMRPMRIMVLLKMIECHIV